MNQIIYAFTGSAMTAAPREDLLPHLRADGFDGIEVPVHPDFIGLRGVEDFASLKSLLLDAGLIAPALAVFWGDPLQSMQDSGMGGVLHSADTVGRMLGSGLAVIRTAQEAPVDPDEARKSLSGTLITALNHCDPAGIKIAVEISTAGPLGGYSEAMDWLYLSHPEVGIAVDTASLADAGADPYRAAAEMGALIRLVYISEPLSSSRFNYVSFFSALKGLDYTGSLALRPASADSADLASQVAQLRETWHAAPVERAAVTER